MDRLQQLENAFRKAHEAGDADAARMLANEIRTMRSQPTPSSMTPQQTQQQMANAYANESAKEMNPAMKFLGGAKTAWDRAAYGLKGMFTDLSPEEQALLQQGQAFNKEAGGWAKAGDVAGDVAITAAPATKLYQGLRYGASMLPRATQLLASPVAAAGSGAVVGAATNPMDRTGGATGGAVGGAVGDVAGRALVNTFGGLVSKSVTPDARQLMDDGVFVPMWKASDNKLVRNIAERAKVFPVSGDIIQGQERSAFESFNRRMARNATPPQPVLDDASGVVRWEKKPVDDFGNDAIQKLRGRFNDAYDALYSGRGIPVDDFYTQQTASVLENTRNYFPRIADDVDSAFKQVDDILRKGTESTTVTSPIVNQSGQPFTNVKLGHAATRPESVKQAIDALDTRIKTAYQRGDAEAAEVLKDLRSAVEDLRIRGLPPEVADQAAEINRAYASFKQLERANSAIGAQTAGMTSPKQLLNAIRATDRTPNKSAFGSGRALNQQDVLLADRVLGSRLPDVGPGTAEKLAPLIGFGLPMIGGDLGATALLGTKTGQRFLMGDLAGQGSVRRYGNQYLVPALRNYGIATGNE